MNRTIMALVILSTLTSCAPRPRIATPDSKIGNNVSIYSETSLALAQDKADKMCGSHAYFITDLTIKNPKPFDPQYDIRYNCDVKQAAELGNNEAYNIMKNKEIKGYKEYIGSVERIKEARRKRADPNKYESYTETDPDGTVRSYNFFGGKSCEVTISPSGFSETHCH